MSSGHCLSIVNSCSSATQQCIFKPQDLGFEIAKPEEVRGGATEEEAKVEKALREQIWLKSGASIVLQHTEALTVIDVNSGKNIIKKEMRENLLRINLEAAKEIAYQLRLRNISGIIIIDFINLLAKEDEAVLLKEFRTYLKDDPVKTDLIDMTKLGLVEVTRKKIRKSLRDSLKMN